MRMAVAGLSVAVALVLGSAPGLAQPITTTQIQYYNIAGTSPVEIYTSMLRRGPRVNGAKAYAATSAQSSQSGFLVSGQSCHVRDYRFSINFVIKLPKLTTENTLSGPVRARWEQFAAFLKKHEETHRAIWTGCAREFERRMSSLRAHTCGELDDAAAKIWDSIRNSCERKHEAFDAAQQRLLVKHPFVRLVLGKPSVTLAADSVATHKRKSTAAALAN